MNPPTTPGSGLAEPRGRRDASVLRNTAWNLAGIASPMLVGVYSLPRVIDGLGTDRFGILTLAWTLAGYFSVFDLGLGRALTHAVAQTRGAGADRDLASAVWTGLALTAALGLIATAAIAGCSPLIVRALRVAPGMSEEAGRAMVVLAFTIPLTTVSAGLRGVLEGAREFAAVNVVRAILGAATFAGPLLALAFSRSLVGVMLVLLGSRLLVGVAYAVLAVRSLPALRARPVLARRSLGPLLAFGGWTTVGNLIGPLLSNVDRFLIASVVSVSVVAYYTTPHEVVSKLLVLPAAMVAVLFPTFAGIFREDRARVSRMYRRATNLTLFALFPPTLAIVALANPLLSLWLGSPFAMHSYSVMQFLAIGVLFNSVAYVPAALLQAVGRPDLPAKLNALELVFYLPALLLVLPRWGVEGAAVLWMARMLADVALLASAARGVLDSDWEMARVAPIAASCALLGCATLLRSTGAGLAFVAIALLAWLAMAWRHLLDDVDRSYILDRLSAQDAK